jgi:hypothetical protein
MNESTGKTPQPNKSQPATQGVAQPPQPPAGTANPVGEYEPIGGFATEGFLRINVKKGATPPDIIDAVTKALGSMTDLPFFRCCPPQAGESALSTRMAPCEILWMCMKQEGP